MFQNICWEEFLGNSMIPRKGRRRTNLAMTTLSMLLLSMLSTSAAAAAAAAAGSAQQNPDSFRSPPSSSSLARCGVVFRRIRNGAEDGGPDSSSYEFPWLAGLEADPAAVDPAATPPSCTGAFVSPRVAVFPAHCVGGAGEEDPSTLRVRVSPSPSAPSASSSASSSSSSVRVLRVVSHPSFRPDHPAGQHDLAVVRVDAAEDLGIGFACLPRPGDDPVDGCRLLAFDDPPGQVSRVTTAA